MEITISVSEQVFPPHDAMHGTPHPVVQRVVVFDLPRGRVEVDQTDYGHPGRFNPCHARRIPSALQPKTNQIVAAAEAILALIG